MTLVTGDDRRVSRALGESAVLGAADAAIASVWDAIATSRTGAAVTRAHRQWRDLVPADRLRAVGVAMLSASVVYVGLTVSHEMPPGWLWVMPPLIASTIGVLMLLRGAALPEGPM